VWPNIIGAVLYTREVVSYLSRFLKATPFKSQRVHVCGCFSEHLKRKDQGDVGTASL